MDSLGTLAPEIFQTTALLVLVLDLVWKGRNSARVGSVTLAGLFVTAFTLMSQWGEESRTVFNMVVVDRFKNFFKLFTVASLAVVVFFVLNDRRERKHGIGEYYFLVSTNNLLLLVLGLELLSLASYSLAGFHKGVFGGLSSGIAGETGLVVQMAKHLSDADKLMNYLTVQVGEEGG